MGWLMGHRGLGEQNRRVGARLAGDERQRGTGREEGEASH